MYSSVRSIRVLLLAVVYSLAVLAGCSFGSKSRPLTELKGVSNTSEEYLVNPGDTLSIKVWGEPKLSDTVLVREKDGKFTMPLINDVPAAGKSLSELSKEVVKLLATFVPDASVTISVVSSAPIRYYLSGAFAKPGSYRSDGQITLLQAIATGGGFAPLANESEVVIIRKSTQSGSAGEVRYELDYNRVIDQKEPNPQLQDGDVLSVSN